MAKQAAENAFKPVAFLGRANLAERKNVTS